MASSKWTTWLAGLACSAALHAGAALLLMGQPQTEAHSAGPALVSVALLAASPLPLPQPAAGAAASATAAAHAPARAAPRYYLPEELDREPIVLRDRSADAGIALRSPCVLELFVDAGGRVLMVKFAGAPPPPALQRQLRAAFGAIEFLPGMLGGKPVPVRLRIELLPPA